MLAVGLFVSMVTDGSVPVKPSDYLTSPDEVELRISSPQRRVLVCEPLRLDVTWTQKRPGIVEWQTEDFRNGDSLALAVRAESQLRLHLEHPHSLDDPPWVRVSMPAGTVRSSEFVFYSGRDDVAEGQKDPGLNLGYGKEGPRSCVFPAEGEYRLSAVLMRPTGEGWEPTEVGSNELTFDVVEPSASQRQVLETLLEAPARFRGEEPEREDALSQLIEQNPGSPYLRWARLRRLERALRRHGTGVDRGERGRAMAESILSEKTWGAFEDDALRIAYLWAEESNDADLRLRIRRQLLAEHAASPVTRQMLQKGQMRDEPDSTALRRRAQELAERAALLERQCEAQDLLACRTLAGALSSGIGVARDQSRANQLFERACAGEMAEACYALGTRYQRGWGAAQDKTRSAQLFQRGCEGGNADACSELARALVRGEGVAEDQARATEFFEKACVLGRADSCVVAGHRLATGTGTPADAKRAAQNKSRALELYKRACDIGEDDACVSAAQIYERGDGVTASRSTAADLYGKACRGERKDVCDPIEPVERASPPR